MSTKKRAAIRKITLNRATFNNVLLEPTAVNFFYGRNGAGKSTIANLIGNKEISIEWQNGKTAADFEVFVYDQNYIDKNFKSFGNLPGVFTFLEENIKIRDEINSLNEQQVQLNNSKNKSDQEIRSLQSKLSAEKNNLNDSIWRNTAKERDRYIKTQTGFQRNKVKFAEKILSCKSVETQDVAELDNLYNAVYDKDATRYPELILPKKIYEYKNFEEKKLLKKSIVNSSNTDFAAFVRALQATEWIRQGKNYLPATNGKCPFCQQYLPPDFEDDLATCFDREYQNNIDALKKYLADYSKHMERLTDAFSGMLNNPFPAVKESELENLIELFKTTVNGNIAKINKKISEPSKIVEKDGTKKILEKIEQTVTEINEKIKAHNSIVDSRKEKQAECTERVFSYMASLCQTLISDSEKRSRKFSADIQAKKKISEQIEKNIQAGKIRVAELTAGIRNISNVKDKINGFLKQSGFQGFSLREKSNDLASYEVVRENGEVADKLSEGERNFIAFLYFYYDVCIGIHENSELKPKVVVIDDPVSSMDSNTLFIISSLVRNLVKLCQSRFTENGESADINGVDQIFILTHNVYFHREITRGQDNSDLFNVVSFYLIRKTKNNSEIIHCIKNSQTLSGEQENHNPVKNSYAVLWDELKELQNAAGVLNTIRQILEHYFIHLCGYDELTLENLILEENRDKFIKVSDDGTVTDTAHHIVSAMIRHLSRTPDFIDEGLNFIDNEDDVDKYLEIFKKIFDAMGQSQHYEMMMGNQK